MKEKFESAKEFVKNHKTDFICGGIVLGCIAAIVVVQACVETESDGDDSMAISDSSAD